MPINPAESTEIKVKDPVCGMNVNPATAKHRQEHRGTTYYFCCAQCQQKFGAEPERYLSPRQPSAGLVTLGSAKPSAADVKAKDPVCGMEVDPASAKHKLDHAGKTYYFCCPRCQEKFQSTPGLYLKPKPQAIPVQVVRATAKLPAPAARAQGAYVCPMCPEVRESKPGPCPSCGMALEPDMKRK